MDRRCWYTRLADRMTGFSWEGICCLYTVFEGRCRASTAYLWWWTGNGDEESRADVEDFIAEIGDLVAKAPTPLGHDGFLVSITTYEPDGTVDSHQQMAGRKRDWQKTTTEIREGLSNLRPSPIAPLVEVQLVNEGEEFLNEMRRPWKGKRQRITLPLRLPATKPKPHGIPQAFG